MSGATSSDITISENTGALGEGKGTTPGSPKTHTIGQRGLERTKKPYERIKQGNLEPRILGDHCYEQGCSASNCKNRNHNKVAGVRAKITRANS